MTTAPGFAVIVGDDIQVSTVSPTKRGAKVNGLVLVFGMRVMNRHTDEQIEVAWTEAVRRFPVPVGVAAVEIVAR